MGLLLSWGGTLIYRAVSKVTRDRTGDKNFPTRVYRHTYTHAHSRHTRVVLGLPGWKNEWLNA